MPLIPCPSGSFRPNTYLHRYTLQTKCTATSPYPVPYSILFPPSNPHPGPITFPIRPPQIKYNEHILQPRVAQHRIPRPHPLHSQRTLPPPLTRQHIYRINIKRRATDDNPEARLRRRAGGQVCVCSGDVACRWIEEGGEVVCGVVGEVEEGGARVENHLEGRLCRGDRCRGGGSRAERWGDAEAGDGDGVESVGVCVDRGDGGVDERRVNRQVGQAANGEKTACGGRLDCGSGEGEGEEGRDLVRFEAGVVRSETFICLVGKTYSEPTTVV